MCRLCSQQKYTLTRKTFWKFVVYDKINHVPQVRMKCADSETYEGSSIRLICNGLLSTRAEFEGTMNFLYRAPLESNHVLLLSLGSSWSRTRRSKLSFCKAPVLRFPLFDDIYTGVRECGMSTRYSSAVKMWWTFSASRIWITAPFLYVF